MQLINRIKNISLICEGATCHYGCSSHTIIRLGIQSWFHAIRK